VQLAWFILFVSSICFEGLGRKYLPGVPSVVFYFMKDVVLLVGLAAMRPGPDVTRAVKWLYRGFAAVMAAAVAWTVIEVFNPESPSKVLGFIGLRAYWLWWVAPLAVAASLRRPQTKRSAIVYLVVVSIGISVLAAFQFASPPSSSLNLYSTVNGEEVYATTATVSATGRARVSGTFSFVSGFGSFVVFVPALLLSLGLEARDRKLRRMALLGTLACASVLPMSGSRSSVLVGGAVLIITAWSAGLIFTKAGRRIVVGAVAAGILSAVAFPQALEGVQSRFAAEEETQARLESVAAVLPPVAMSTFDYPALGIGTGMQQNARLSFGTTSRYDEELPAARYLVELGPVGYVLVWVANLGLVVALLRASTILKRAGRPAARGAALSYALLALVATSAFDHIAQALFFMGCGFILSEVMEVSARPPVPAVPQRRPR
jgi:hypothetical protein